MNHRIVTITGLVTVTAATLLGTVAAPAQARVTCSDDAVRCMAPSVSPYAELIQSLDRQTLAQRVAAHRARDPRLAVAV